MACIARRARVPVITNALVIDVDTALVAITAFVRTRVPVITTSESRPYALTAQTLVDRSTRIAIVAFAAHWSRGALVLGMTCISRAGIAIITINQRLAHTDNTLAGIALGAGVEITTGRLRRRKKTTERLVTRGRGAGITILTA